MNPEKLKQFNIELGQLLRKFDFDLKIEQKIVVVDGPKQIAPPQKTTKKSKKVNSKKKK